MFIDQSLQIIQIFNTSLLLDVVIEKHTDDSIAPRQCVFLQLLTVPENQDNPRTGNRAPWMARAASEARKQITLARSSGVTHLL